MNEAIAADDSGLSCFQNLWAISDAQGDIVIVSAVTEYGAIEMASLAGFRPFGWLYNYLLKQLTPGVPRQILYFSPTGILFADQLSVAGLHERSPVYLEYRDYLAGREAAECLEDCFELEKVATDERWTFFDFGDDEAA